MIGSVQLGGVIPPIVTPLATDGSIDGAALAALADRLIVAGVGGLFALGTAGEGPWLTFDERRRATSIIVDAVAGRVPVLVGAIETSTRRVRDEIEQAAGSGADAVVVTSPFYFDADAAQQRAHFADAIEHASVPVVLYDVPSRTRNPVEADTIGPLIESPRVIGVKESAGDFDVFDGVLDLKGRRADLAVLQGIESQASASMARGADGLVPALANAIPSVFVDLVRAAELGDTDATERQQRVADGVGELYEFGPRLACLKYAVACLGFGTGATCHDGWTLPDTTKEAIRRHLDEHDVN